MTPAMEALVALQMQLQTISTANGYLTDPQLVALSRPALALDRAELPALTLQSTDDDPADGNPLPANQIIQTWRRSVVLSGVVDGVDWETALDALLVDVRRAFAAADFSELTLVNGPKFFPPSAAGELAFFTMMLSVDYELNLRN